MCGGAVVEKREGFRPIHAEGLEGFQIASGVDRTYVVLLTELLGEGGGHAHAALAAGSLEVRLPGLRARRGKA